MGDPFAPVGSRSEVGGRHPSDELQERVALLGFSLSDFEDLISAFGDPDSDESARQQYAVGDRDLRSLVLAAKGENPDGYRPARLANHPTGEQFEIGWTVERLLDYVGDDAEKALAVFESEEAKGEDARSTLIDKLERIIDA